MYCLGIEDEDFIRGKVPMTKQEIRIVTIAKAHIAPDAIVYDIGAGTGSISIEAARQAYRGCVYALEKNPDGIRLIRANAANFAVPNISIMETEAPQGLQGLPKADAVIIGGSGGHLCEIMDCLEEKTSAGARVVINCVSLQTLHTAMEYLREHKQRYRYEAVELQATRIVQVKQYDMMKATNPIFIVTYWRADEGSSPLMDADLAAQHTQPYDMLGEDD